MSRRVFLPLLLFTVGCSCEIREPFRWLHDSFVQKIYNWVPADIEAAKYLDRETESREYLQMLRGLPTIYLQAEHLVKDGFHWHAENFDFTSYAWVTIARKRGDCDDFMELWREILKVKGETKRVTVTSGDSAHAMLFFYDAHGNLYLLSNLQVLGTGKKGDEDRLVRLHYGDKTRCWIAY